MARKQKSSPIEDLTMLVAMMPWWVGITLAVIAYVVLHRFAIQPIPTFKPSDMNGALIATSIRGISTIAQYVVPGICVFGAVISIFKRRKRTSLLAKVALSPAADSLEKMSWREFEMLVGEAFRLQGYKVLETGGAGADGGIDLVLAKGSEKFLVQCKQWKAFKVSVNVVRELYGVMAAKGAAGGFVVTSGIYTSDATQFAAGRNIELIDGPVLLGMIKQVRGDRAAPIEPYFADESVPMPTRSTPFACPSCGSMMKRRVAKKGANAGNEFWGCSTYPKCTGTRPIA